MTSTLPALARLVVTAVTLSAAAFASGAPASQRVFPQETVLWFSLPNAPQFREKFNATQLGMLADDEKLAPFCEQLREQAMRQLGDLHRRLGVSLDDVLDAAGGELAIGVAHRPDAPAATIILIDPSGSEAAAKTLVDRVHVELTSRDASVRQLDVGGVDATVYQIPQRAGDKIVSQELYRFQTQGRLCYVERSETARAVIAALAGAGGASLESSRPFQATMSRCDNSGSGAPDVRWFLDPFGYDAAQRSRQVSPQIAEKDDTITLLREQGFDAIRGVGGHVHVKVDQGKDFVHHTAIHAPPKPGREGRPANEKYDLGMRMAETPNRDDLDIESWAPRSTANYTTFSVDIQNAFDNLETVFDAMSGFKGAFKNTLEGFEKDPYGPRIRFREQIIAKLGDRVTRMADYGLPITTDCERFLFVIDTKDPEGLREPIDKWMENDGALRRTVGGVQYWEIVPEEQLEAAADLGGGLIPLDDQAAEVQDEALLRRAAVCVHDGKLIVASDVEFLEQVLFGVESHEQLMNTYDYQAAMRELKTVVKDSSHCSWAFTRSDESVRPTYELLREGKLPEGQTFFARLMNKLLTTSEDLERGIVRRQRIDGSDLPGFECARRYFGPTARAVKAEEDGWFISGVVLNKAEGQRVATR